ncbi:hypothetical protein IC582_000558 [Cucumis melo]
MNSPPNSRKSLPASKALSNTLISRTIHSPPSLQILGTHSPLPSPHMRIPRNDASTPLLVKALPIGFQSRIRLFLERIQLVGLLRARRTTPGLEFVRVGGIALLRRRSGVGVPMIWRSGCRGLL